MAVKFSREIQKGIDFLYKAQQENGNFPGSVFIIEKGKWLRAQGTIFSTSVITHCLNNILKNKDVLDIKSGGKCSHMIRRSLGLFQDEMRMPGLWRFGLKNDNQWRGLPFDTDDTCCVSHLMKNYNPYIHLGTNKNIILRNRNEDNGLFFTWFLPGETDMINDVDSVVNVNACLYLGENETTGKVTAYINDLVNSGKEAGSFYYYIDEFSLYYMISRAYRDGISQFCGCIPRLIKNINDQQTFTNLLTEAISLTTLVNIDYDGCEFLENRFSSIAREQGLNGSWDKYPFYQGEEYPKPVGIYFGSECITTALCLEALVNSSILIKN